MSSRSTSRASSPNATAPFDPLFARLFLAQRALFPAPVLRASCLLAWRPSPPDLATRRGVPGAGSTILGLTPAFSSVRTALFCGSLVRPICAELPWYQRGPPWMVVLVWRQCVPLLRQLISAAAFAYLPQQAAARMVLLGWLACVWQSRPDGWTSTPRAIRASRGATAKTTPERWLPRGCGHCWLHRGGFLHCALLRPGVPLLRHHESAAAFDYLPQQAAARMDLAGCFASARQRRPDGWTSTPRAGRGATAETTPKALFLLVWTALSRLLAADGKSALLVPESWL